MGFRSALPILLCAVACGTESGTTDGGADVQSKDVAREALVDAGPCGRVGYVLDDSYDSRCGFCYASASAYLPPPIEWEPCSANAFPVGVACLQMKRTWPVGTSVGTGTSGQYFEGEAKGYVDATGHAVLAFGIASDDTFQEVVAQADGATLTTWLETSPEECSTVTMDARDGFFAMHVYAVAPIQNASIAGPVTDLHPRAFAATSADDRVSALGLLDWPPNAFELYDWSTGIGQSLYQGNQEGLSIGPAVMTSNAVFFVATDSHVLKEQVWAPDAGVQDFISYGTDTSQGAGSLGTDGTDLVWTHASDRDGGTGAYPVDEIVTSPYATSPADLQPRALLSEGSCSVESDEYIVGCGYAVHRTCADLPSEGLRIVRLADGRSWSLVSNNTPFGYDYPIAVTCDEVFAVISENNVGDIVRIKIASLGPGDPPN